MRSCPTIVALREGFPDFAERGLALVDAGDRVFPHDDALVQTLGLPADILDLESFDVICTLVLRLAGGGLTWGSDLRARLAVPRIQGPSDRFAALRQLMGAMGMIQVRAGTLARWFGRRPASTFPDDLREDLLAACPAWNLRFGFPNGRIPLDCLVGVQSDGCISPPACVLRDEVGPSADGALVESGLAEGHGRFTHWKSAAQRTLTRQMMDPSGPSEMLGVLPTGGGKSLTFLLPALLRTRRGLLPGLTIVVSPIIALMNDQVEHARFLFSHVPHFCVAEWNGTVQGDARREVLRKLARGQIHVLYLSPETILDPWFMNRLAHGPAPILHFVVDEVHMVREWGEDFRCDFQRLGSARQYLLTHHPGMRTLLLSATLPTETRRAVLRALRCPSPSIVEHSADRPELTFTVHLFENAHSRDAQVLPLLRSLPRPGIIYCTRTEACTRLREQLRETGFHSCAVYFGETVAEERKRILRGFQDGCIDLVIATNAFGLGVDKPDVRFVLHYQVPESIERYAQEAGRGGRDGAESQALLLYCPEDASSSARMAAARLRTEKIVGRYESMWACRTEVPEGTLLDSRVIPEYSGGGVAPLDSPHLGWNEVALNMLERAGLLDVEGHVITRATLRGAPTSPAGDALEMTLAQEGTHDLPDIARGMNTPLRLVQGALFRVISKGKFDVDLESAVLVKPRRTVDNLIEFVHRHRENERKRELTGAQEMREYAHSHECRARIIARFLGTSSLPPPCGRCDVCKADPSLSTRIPMPADPELQELSLFLNWYRDHAGPALAETYPVLAGQFDRDHGSLRQRLENPARLQVAFIGSTTVGKSTTINALLGERLLPECKIGATTARQVIIRYAPRRRVIVRYTEEARIESQLEALRKSWDDALESAREGEEFRKDDFEREWSYARNLYGFPANYSLKRKDIDNPLPGVVRQRLGTTMEFTGDIKTYVDEHVAGQMWASVEEVVVEIDHPLLASGIEIVDLPGTGDIDAGRVKSLREFVTRADQFVLVLGVALMTDDVRRLLDEYDLWIKLFQCNRSLLVLGTKIDTVQNVDQASRDALHLDESLPSIRMKELIWASKAEGQIRERFRDVLRRLNPPEPDEDLTDWDRRLDGAIQDQFGSARFMPLNPKAFLDLTPETAFASSTEAERTVMREWYPTLNDTGVPAVSKQLRAMADARYQEHRNSLLSEGARFVSLVTEQLKQTRDRVAGTDTRAARAALAKIREPFESELVSWLDDFREMLAQHRSSMEGRVRSGRETCARQGRKRIFDHLKLVFWSTLRAAVQPHRLGVFQGASSRVDLPRALFETSRTELISDWKRLRSDVTISLGRLQTIISGACKSLASVALEAPPATRAVIEAQATKAGGLLNSAFDAVSRDCIKAVDEFGLPLPEVVVDGVKEGMRKPCATAAAERGRGVKDRMVTVLALGTPAAGDILEGRLDSLLPQIDAIADLICLPDDASRVFDDFDHFLHAITESDDILASGDALRAALELRPHMAWIDE